MMKKLLAMLLALTMILSLAACGGKAPAETKAPANQNGQTTPVEDHALSHTFSQYGDARITIVGAEFTQNDWEEDLLRIYYDYTNLGENARGHYPSGALDIVSVTQDGEDCETTVFGEWDETAIAEDLNCDSNVQPGCTSRNTMLVLCDPDGGIVEVTCYVMVGSWMYNPDEVETFTFQIDPKNMMGAPEPYVLPAITAPTYAAGMSASGSFDYPLNCQVSIDGFELAKGPEGEDGLRVNMTVTNLDEDYMTPELMCGPEVYQDGVGLVPMTTWFMEDLTEGDEAYSQDLYPGETVQCSALFYLRSENPVEVVIESTNSELSLGATFELAEAIAAARAAEEAENAAEEAARQEAAANASEAMKALAGSWDRTDGWDDALEFRVDGTGFFDMTGDVFPFSYTIDGQMLYLNYDDGDSAEYTYEISGDELILTDYFDDTMTFVRVGG